MNASTAVARRISAVHVNKWDKQLQTGVEGWELKYLWLRTDTVLTFFVPDAAYSPENVDTLLRFLGAKDEEMHALGG